MKTALHKEWAHIGTLLNFLQLWSHFSVRQLQHRAHNLNVSGWEIQFKILSTSVMVYSARASICIPLQSVHKNLARSGFAFDAYANAFRSIFLMGSLHQIILSASGKRADPISKAARRSSVAS